AAHDDPVPAGALELGAPVAAGLRFAEGAGERRFRAHAVAAGAGHGGAGDDARREDQDVVGAERVGAPRHVLEQVVGDEAAATGVAAEEGVARLLDPRASIGEADVQDPVPVSVSAHGSRSIPPTPPSIGLSSMTSAPSASGVSGLARSPFTAAVSSVPGAMPMAASRSATVAPSRSV